MTELISHKQTFRKLKEDLTLQRERALQQIIREINKKNILNNTEYSNLNLKDSKPAWLYGATKIYKAFLPDSLPPFQAFVSSIGTYNYNLTQYLGSLLSPHIPPKYSSKDSFTFIE